MTYTIQQGEMTLNQNIIHKTISFLLLNRLEIAIKMLNGEKKCKPTVSAKHAKLFAITDRVKIQHLLCGRSKRTGVWLPNAVRLARCA